MKARRLSLILALLLMGCLEEKESPKGKHSTVSQNCDFHSPTGKSVKVVNIVLSGSQPYIGVNNVLFVRQTRSMLPKLAPQFRGIVTGSDVLTLGGGAPHELFDFGKLISQVFPLTLPPNEEIILQFYDQQRPDNFKPSCVFEWSD